MRIDGNGRIAGPASGSAPRRSSGATFSLPTGSGAPETKAARSAAPMTGLESMLALQSVEDPLARRRKAMRRGGNLLDVLDAMKVDVLAGVDDLGRLERLRAMIAEARDPSGEPGLDSVLDEIELRAQVEIAKRSARRG